MILFISLFLVACGTNSTILENNNLEPITLVYAQWTNPVSFDPIGSNDVISTEVQGQIFEGLTGFAEDGTPIPLLAESFFAIDETTWQFNLKRNVYFHNGDYFNAYAVYRSIERIINPLNASPRTFILNMISEINIIDDYTVQFVTTFPFSPLPSHLALAAAFIASPTAIENDTLQQHPVGTGPFMFYSHTSGVETIMHVNPNYHGEIPDIDILRFLVVPDSHTRLNMLETGEINVTFVSANDANSINNDENLNLIEAESARQNYIGFNTQISPFNDERVRRAIAMVVDIDSIVASVEGLGISPSGPLPPSVIGASSIEPISGSLNYAIELLSEAGFPNGFDTNIIFSSARPVEERLTAEILQSNLELLGIRATVQEMENAAFLEATALGNHEIFILSWTVVTLDADYGLFPLFHSSMHGGWGNRTFYTNPVVDDLLIRARMTDNPTTRNNLYREISEIISNEVPIITTFYSILPIGTNGVEHLRVGFHSGPYFRKAVMIR
ncbi:MAG: ABC transporter substrate-binding protein [Defluviitaleaceae bacterium]|nr:ABC transporter substrate-binding protein [Defluviitaleaceae bacterium]